MDRWEYFSVSSIYSYLLAFLYAIFSRQIFLIQLFQVFLSTAIIPIIYLVGKNLHSERVGYISAFLAGVYGGFIFYSGAILEVTLQIFLISILMFFITQDFEKKVDKKWFFIELFLGLCSLSQSIVLIFAIGAIVWLFVNRRTFPQIKKNFSKVIFYFAVGILLVLIPSAIRNYSTSESFFVITPVDGLSF